MMENEVLQNEYNVHMMHDHPLLHLDEATAFGKQELLYQMVHFHLLSETISDHLTTTIIYIFPTTPQSIMGEL